MISHEKHEKKFRGWFIPADIVSYLEEGIINCQEMVLLALIDSLVNVKGVGCFASNDYLGQKLSLSGSRIKQMIGHLKELGLIKQVSFDGRKRYLETAWSRVNSISLSESEQSACQDSDSQHVKIQSNRPPGSCQADRQDLDSRVSKSISLSLRNKNKGVRTKSAPLTQGIDSEDVEWDEKQATRVREMLVRHKADLVAPKKSKNGKVRNGVALKTITEHITNLRMNRDISKQEIKSVIGWMVDHYNEPYIPSLRRADDIYTHWKKFHRAKQLWEFDNDVVDVNQSSNGSESNQLASKVITWLDRNGRWDPFGNLHLTQDMVDEALVALGKNIGEVTVSFVTTCEHTIGME